MGSSVAVVGIDGSAPSWDALAWAAGDAQRGGGRIVAVFVTSDMALLDPGATLAAADTTERVARELASEVARRAKTLGVEVRFMRGAGNTSRVLSEVARSV